MRARATPWLVSMLLAAPAASARQLARGHEDRSAFADLHDRQGHAVGDVLVAQEGEGVVLHVDLFGLAKGEYVLAPHAVADCRPPFRGAGKALGDALVVFVGQDGGGEADATTKAVAVVGRGTLFDWDGSAFVLAARDAPDLPLACGTVKH